MTHRRGGRLDSSSVNPFLAAASRRPVSTSSTARGTPVERPPQNRSQSTGSPEKNGPWRIPLADGKSAILDARSRSILVQPVTRIQVKSVSSVVGAHSSASRGAPHGSRVGTLVARCV